MDAYRWIDNHEPGLVDTTIVIVVIFWGQPLGVMFRLIIVSGYLFKVAYEIACHPAGRMLCRTAERVRRAWIASPHGTNFKSNTAGADAEIEF